MMRKSISIWLSVLCVLGAAAILPSCKTANLPPMDDAYYWEEHRAVETVEAGGANEVTQPVSEPNQPKQRVEFISVQDTTVTVKIRR